MSLKPANLESSSGQPQPEGMVGDGSSAVTSSARSAGTAQGAVLPSTFGPDEIEALYLEHRTLLLYVSARKFRVPEEDAENLIQEVFLSFLQTGTKIENIRAWLVAAACNASRHYWRMNGRLESLPDDFQLQSDPQSHGGDERLALQMTMRQALDYLQPRCRETLFLHYFEGRSASDMARELETTVRYAEKLIHNCLKRVREIYLRLTVLKG